MFTWRGRILELYTNIFLETDNDAKIDIVVDYISLISIVQDGVISCGVVRRSK